LYEALGGHEGSSQFFRIQHQDRVKGHQCVGQEISVRLKLTDYNLNICVSASEDVIKIESDLTFGRRRIAEPTAFSVIGFK
jgi:hypothetical protein